MKNLSLVFIMFLSVYNAQTKSGNWMIGGSTNLAFNSENVTYKLGKITEEAPKVNTFSFTPSFGYFFADDFALGLDVNAFISKKSEEFAGSDYVTKTTRLSAMPVLTYYYQNESSFLPYVGAGLGYGVNNQKESYLGKSEIYNYNGFTWKLKAGANFFVAPSVAFDLALGYGKFHGKKDYEGKQMSITHKNFVANIGICVFLKNKKQKRKA